MENTSHRLKAYFIWCLLVPVGFGAAVAAAQAQEQKDKNILFSQSLLQGLEYRMIGPFRGGRVTAVDGIPGKPPVLYFGATGGGVWRTANNGMSYENVSDGYLSAGSIGAIAIADSDPDVIYAGTGSACIRSNVSTGRGVFKTEDGAKTWQFVGLPQAGQIGAIEVHPENPDLVYVAALGHPFGPNPERGVYRSKDGGKSWQRVLFVSDSTGAVDLSINPENPAVLYASMWRGERKPWTIISGGKEGGIYRTTDGGDTWQKLTRGLPEGLIGKTAVSVSPADTKRIYVLVEAPNGQGGLYRSDDSGDHFKFVNSQLSLMNRPFYYTHVTADPNDADLVYVNNEGFFRSTDGGETFERRGTPHGDNHDMWINPDNSLFIFQANDGGVNVTVDGGESWSTQYNQATAELYHVVVDNQFPYWVYGEQQDNSTIMVPSIPPIGGQYLSPKQFWRAVAGCETGPLAVNPLDPDIVYGGCKGRFSRSNHRTGQVMQYWVYPHFNYGHAASEMPYRFQRTSPIEISPHNPNVIYHTSQYVHKTTDEGKTWETISPDLTANDPTKQGYSGGPITRDITGEEIYSAIYAFRESLHEEGVLWSGSNDGAVYISRNSGKDWRNITPPDLPPGGRVQTLEPSPHDPGSAYMAVYRYMLDDWSPYIYKTRDYGATWRRLTTGRNGIPFDHPTRVVRADPKREGLLYAGTEFGIFISFDDGAHWQSFQLELPTTPITDIRVHRDDLVLSTMGRSFWILDDLTPLHQLDTTVARSQAHLFKPRNAYRMTWPARRRSREATPEYPPVGAMIYYYLAEETQQEIQLEVLDRKGTLIQTFSSDTTKSPSAPESGSPMRPIETVRYAALSPDAGLHRFIWDLRYPGTLNADGTQFGSNGPKAVPGAYQIRLRMGSWQQSQPLTILQDPRVAADGVTLAHLEEQFKLNSQIRDRISELRQAVLKIGRIQSQLDSFETDKQIPSELVKNVEMVRRELNRLENALIQTQAGKVGAQLKPKLYRQLTYLYGMTTAADQQPGRDAFARFKDIEKILAGHQHDLDALLRGGLGRLNEMLQRAGHSSISID